MTPGLYLRNTVTKVKVQIKWFFELEEHQRPGTQEFQALDQICTLLESEYSTKRRFMIKRDLERTGLIHTKSILMVAILGGGS